MTTIVDNLAYVPEVFTSYVANRVMKSSAFFQSSAVVNVPALVPLYGNSVVVPAWNGLTGYANVLGDGCQTSTALTSSKNVGAVLERGKIFGLNGLVQSFSGSNPLDALADQVADFWARDIEAALVASALGSAEALGATVLRDISGGAGSAAVISGAEIIKTAALAGEYMNDYTMIVMNSQVYALLLSQNLIQFIPNSEGRFFNSYMGKEVIITDTLVDNAGVYDTLLVKPGAFGYAENTDPAKAVEFDRDVKCNEDIMSIQKRYIVHPMGAAFAATITGRTASNAELADKDNWVLGAADTKHFGVRVLRHKIA